MNLSRDEIQCGQMRRDYGAERCIMQLLLYVMQRNTARSHWLSAVMVETASADTVRYKTSVVAFVNALLHGVDNVVERCRLREQLLTGHNHSLYIVTSLYFSDAWWRKLRR